MTKSDWMYMNWEKLWNFIKDKYVYIVTFLLASLMMLIAWVIGDVGPFGGKSLIVVDGVHQYLPFFSEYQEKLKSFDSLQYSFHVGMGNNFLSLWSYYLASPFNLIILFCSKKSLPTVISLIISLKIIAGAVVFAYFLMHAGRKPKKNPSMIAFSLFYAFSSYCVGYYWNLMWLDCVYVFPLIILGMERMFAKKDSRMYILALLYSFICNYYISFMICIFLVLWFFTFHFYGIKDFFIKGVRFAIASLTTAAMSAAILLPAYKGIMTTASAEFELPEWTFYGNFADTLRSHLFCSEVMTNQIGDGGTNLYCGVLTVLLAIMFFFIRDISLSKKIKYLALIVMFVISFNNERLNYIWHGFHNQYGIPNRFAFIYIFLLIIMAYEVYLKRESIKLPMVVGAYMASMLFVIFCYYHAKITYDKEIYIISAILLTIYLILLGIYSEISNYKAWIGLAIILVAIVEAGTNGYFGFEQVGTSDAKFYFGDTKTFEQLKSRVEDADDSFCRADILQPIPVDEATWYNLNSIGIFGSTVRGEMVDIMGDLGFYTGANEYLYYGATPVTNALFNVRYVYTREDDFVNVDMNEYDKQDHISVYKNEYTLPIGYMVQQEVLTYNTDDNGPFTVLNELSGALSGIEPIFTSVFDDWNTEAIGTNVNVYLKDDNNAEYAKASDSARADMIYTVPYDMDLYMSLRGSNLNKIALLIDGNEVAYDRYQGQLFHVGNVKAGQLVDIQFVLKDGEYRSGELYCYPMKFDKEQFEKFYQKLSSQTLQVTKSGSTKIEGTLSAKEDGIFMTSIPYDEGWSIYANGKPLETLAVINDSFLAAKLPAGDYQIELKYQCPGLWQGILLTLVGLVAFVLISKIEQKVVIYKIKEVSVHE